MDEVGSGAGLAAERLPPPRLRPLFGGAAWGVPRCVWIGRGLIFFQGSRFIPATLLPVPLQL